MRTKELSTCFCTNDIEACREFYMRYFGAKVTFDCGWYVNLRINGDGPDMQFMKPQDQTPVFSGQGVVLNFQVEDVDAEHTRLTGVGLTAVMPLEDHPWGDRGFALVDPIGTFVYIYEQREPTEEFKAYYKE